MEQTNQVLGEWKDDAGNIWRGDKVVCYAPLLCLACGYSWRPNKLNPVCCPRCHVFRKKKGQRKELKIMIVE